MPSEPLTAPEREEIRAGIAGEDSLTAIALRLGRDRSTGSREVNLNGGRFQYRACGSGTPNTYNYDPTGVRTPVGGAAQLWDRNNSLPLLVIDGQNGLWPTYADGMLLGQSSSFYESWAKADALGSTRAETDPTANVAG